jgi:hypothetical protein
MMVRLPGSQSPITGCYHHSLAVKFAVVAAETNTNKTFQYTPFYTSGTSFTIYTHTYAAYTTQFVPLRGAFLNKTDSYSYGEGIHCIYDTQASLSPSLKTALLFLPVILK